ncbi:flagellar basal-body rod protein FlgF [Balneatrix alpica]|uniref:Flagellar basal-body rod protein FlgF n=1 Tax=Balneatrix alpica TaxID=75684 RepID=A0ABV5ZEJ2_9GAMM|nr:flagellar basal-body rod protein FlgF [Balneatrix alpica]
MDRALFLAMSGAKQNMWGQAIHANNLANVSTTGFRRDFEQARSMQVFGESFPSRVYNMTENPATDFTPGTLKVTGSPMDVAIGGDGFIAVQREDGSEAYTRVGSLTVDPLGQLRTGKGLPVIGEGGPIVLPPFSQIEIGGDGTITIVAEGDQPANVAEIDRIKLVNPEIRDLIKGEDGLFSLENGQPALADAQVQLRSGYLESSNVNPVEEFTAIMSLSRQYEMNVKMMKTVEENAAAENRLLQIG